MARLLVGAVFGVLVGVGLGAAAGIHAMDPTAPDNQPVPADQVQDDAAAEAGGDIDLPDDPPAFVQPTPAPKPVVPAVRAVWDRLAYCESRGDWHINTGNGYYGGLQEDMTFWRRHGGMQYASRPDLATREAQVAVAEVGLAAQGWGAWPNCSRILGLR